ncbi:zinc finger protein OZF-like [Anthonomus grandis grandis]|uniref:zinc finger protein OZF-like n=1 Tax=Anthonomus grandis grandis TaxID=2921223 RepID=UPI002164F3D0|nr:zinc finger protein OZF-like [Anthonomus grandis grandis]
MVKWHNLLKIKTEEVLHLTCDHCSKTFAKKYQLLYHLKTVHKDASPFECSECHKTYKFREKLEQHLAKHQRSPKAPNREAFGCDICHKTLYSKQGLIAHTKRHMKLYSIKCDTCGKGFFGQNSLRLHINSKHSGKSEFICGICFRPCYDKGSLKNHIEKHRAEYKTRLKVKCEECGQEFLDQKYLKIHMAKKHNMDNRFVCDLCGKKLYSKSGLADHMNIHQGLKPHKCEFCGTGFANSTTLRLHVRRHTGERPYKCTMCEKAFIQSHSLKAHLRLHSGERPFCCSLCGKGCITSNALRQHMRSTHKVDDVV